MKKKAYKKNKKVVEKVIYLRASSHKKLNLSTLFLSLGVLFISASLYYLNVWFFVDSTTPLTMKYLGGEVSKIHIFGNNNEDFVPFSADWENVLLKKKPVSSKQQKKDLIVSARDGSDQIIWHGPRDKKEVALTFDADMTPVMIDYLHSGQVSTYDDPRIVDYLTQHNISATFFLTGLWIQTYPDATRALASNPQFELENHSYSHPSMAGDCFGQPQVPQSQYPFEIEKVQQLLQQIAHVTPKYFRFPGGCYDDADLALVKKEGLTTVHWDDVADDGFNDNKDAIIHNVLSEAQNGSIIVLHIGGTPNVPATPDALPTIVDGLEKRGFTFVTVDQLLTKQPIAEVTPEEYLTSLQSFQTVSP
ncbi:MAG TPA: polysaccharide deacetylase family protein [Candidatus Saccharimonadales bacterium]|nr:polysaccharide deacetylase family protein [Candidatus Saccharimonadales bacterium]